MKQPALFLLISFLFLALLPGYGPAGESMVNCHCFRDRSYDPDHKFAADEYLVATTFNSLIAKSFKISKREIVMKKMQGGVDPDDLLIVLYLARVTDKDADLLLSIRNNGGSWQQILQSAGPGTTVPGNDPVLNALARGADKKKVASLITEDLVSRFFSIDKQEIERLYSRGFSGQQITVICALAHHAKQSPQAIADMYRQEKMSWAEIAACFNLTPKEVGQLIT